MQRTLVIFSVLMLWLAGSTAIAGIFPKSDWLTATPESQGVKSAELDAAMAYLKAFCGSDGTNQSLVVRHGYIIWQGNDIDTKHSIWSCGKTFCGIMAGLLAGDGRCTMETLGKNHLPFLSAQYPNVTLRHFATMTSGYNGTGLSAAAPHFAPGTMLEYSNTGMDAYANVLTQIAGESLYDLFKRRIADPIGMDPAQWSWGSIGTYNGHTIYGGAGNISITAREFARLGLLITNRGNWDGQQLLSADWIEQATQAQIDTTIPPYDAGQWYTTLIGAYGFNFWVNGYRPGQYGTNWGAQLRWPDAPPKTAASQGYNNNYCFSIPEWDMVIVRMGTDRAVNNDFYRGFFTRLKPAIISDGFLPNAPRQAFTGNLTQYTFPNPVNRLVVIKLNDTSQPGIVTIFSSLGNKVKQLKVHMNQTAIDIQDLPNGLYFYTIEQGNFTNIYKFIVAR